LRVPSHLSWETFAAWVAGLLIAFGMTQVLAQIFNRLGEVIYVLQLIGGVILIILGYNLDKFASPQIPTKRPKSSSQFTFLLGATMAFVEAPTALPILPRSNA